MNIDDIITKYKLVKSTKVIDDNDEFYVFNNHDYNISTGFVIRKGRYNLLFATDVYYINDKEYLNPTIAYGPWDLCHSIEDVEEHVKKLRRKYSNYLIRYKKDILKKKIDEMYKDFQ